jgi:hypothetical protein
MFLMGNIKSILKLEKEMSGNFCICTIKSQGYRLMGVGQIEGSLRFKRILPFTLSFIT